MTERTPGSAHAQLPCGPVGAVIGSAPEAGPVDELAAARLRRAIATHLGAVPNLDAHLALLDARGAWYAIHAVAGWDPAQGEAFFGLVRHAVRTLMGGPVPAPDIEGWLAAGPPADPRTAGTWIEVLQARFPSLHVGSLPNPAIARPVGDVHHVDVIVENWPAGGLPGFIHAYATVEATLDEHGLTLPPIDA